MKKIINKFLLIGDKFMPEETEDLLVKPIFTYISCKLFKRNLRKLKETRDSKYFYQNKQDEFCFQGDMTFRVFKGLPKRSYKILRDKAFNIAKNAKYDGLDLQ